MHLGGRTLGIAPQALGSLGKSLERGCSQGPGRDSGERFWGEILARDSCEIFMQQDADRDADREFMQEVSNRGF